MSISCSNNWTQRVEDRGMMASNGIRVVEKTTQDQNLRCPRCDSSNTKFCYYNNYSLSQPRHFCKACKRYWTRGGTLRNVPVGGGYRKNKRIKRAITTAVTVVDIPTSLPAALPLTRVDVSIPSNDINPLFYGLTNMDSNINLSIPKFQSVLATSNAMEFGFPLANSTVEDAFRSVFNPTKPQSAVSSCLVSPEFSPLYGSSSSTTTSITGSSMPSTLKQYKVDLDMKGIRSVNDFQSIATNFQDFHTGMSPVKPVKMEEENNRFDWQIPSDNTFETLNTVDPSLYWNPSLSSWPETPNFGSSITPLM